MKKPELSEHENKKKVYTPPQLQVYGDLRSITTNTGFNPHSDPPPHNFPHPSHT